MPKCEIFDLFDFHYFIPESLSGWATLGLKLQCLKKYLGVSLGAQSLLCVCSAKFFQDKFFKVLSTIFKIVKIL